MHWLMSAAWGLPRYIWIAIVVALLSAGVLWLRSAEQADDEVNQKIGRTEERAATTGEVLERVEQGNAVRNEVEAEADRGSGGALYEQCLLAQRGDRSVCQRFLPQ